MSNIINTMKCTELTNAVQAIKVRFCKANNEPWLY